MVTEASNSANQPAGASLSNEHLIEIVRLSTDPKVVSVSEDEVVVSHPHANGCEHTAIGRSKNCLSIQVGSLDSLFRVGEHSLTPGGKAGLSGSLIVVSREEVVYYSSPAARRPAPFDGDTLAEGVATDYRPHGERAILSLAPGGIHSFLRSIKGGTKDHTGTWWQPYDAKSFRKVVRSLTRYDADGSVVALLQRSGSVEFRSQSESRFSGDQGRESLGRDVKREVSRADELPQSISLTGDDFICQAGALGSLTVGVYVDVDLDRECFLLGLPEDVYSRAKSIGLVRLWDVIAGAAKDNGINDSRVIFGHCEL